MAHDRNRHVLGLYQKLLTTSPIVGVFGHRQVGKSTFISKEVSEYRTLDDQVQLDLAAAQPKEFINSISKTPLAIDECQLEPKLFPALKEWVRTHKKPGQFVLSGSVRFTSRRAIRESLAGRMSFLEMLPFSVAELENDDLPDAIPRLLEHKLFSTESGRILNPSSKLPRISKAFELYLKNGGLPGLCFLRNDVLRNRNLSDLHDLILDRDLRLVLETKISIATIKKLLSYIAEHTFEAYNSAEVRRKLGLAPQTQKNLLYAMESVFLIRRISIPLRKKEIFLLEDQLEEMYYSSEKTENIRHLESAVYRNIRSQFAYRLNRNVEFSCYLTRDHARVPMVIKNVTSTLGIVVTEGETPTLSETRSGDSFLKNHGNAKILYLSSKIIAPKIISERSMLCSIYAIL